MRRLHHSRSDAGEARALEGFDAGPLEGDLVGSSRDEGPLLRPYAADFSEPVVGVAQTTLAADEDRDLRRARELEGLGRRLDAVLVLRQALADRPEAVDVRLALASMLDRNGDTEDAIEVLTAGLGRGFANPQLLIPRGALLGKLNRHAEAEADLRRALDSEPNQPEAHLQLGIALVRRGRIPEALPVLQRARQLDQDNGEAAFHLGEVLYHLGDLSAALDTLRRATELAPRDPRAFKLQGRLLDRQGRTEEAMVMHRKARDLGGR